MPDCPHCGCEFEERKRRSPAHHRHFFAAIQNAYDQWPLESTFLPDGPEHLRAYLLVRAGHFVTLAERLTETAGDVIRMADLAEKLMRYARHHGGYGFVEVTDRGGIVTKFPRTIRWKEVSEAEFSPIAQKVYELIEAEIGVPVDQLVREAAA